MAVRKIVQIAATETEQSDGAETTGTLYALADDGTVWLLVDPWTDGKFWRRVPALPEGEL